MASVVIFCNGFDESHPHAWYPVARYERPHAQGDELIDTWGSVRSWRDESGMILTTLESERWVTDDHDASTAGNLSLTDLHRLFRYRCELCSFDYQRVGRSRYADSAADAWSARDHALDALVRMGIGDCAVRAFVEILERFMAGDTPR